MDLNGKLIQADSLHTSQVFSLVRQTGSGRRPDRQNHPADAAPADQPSKAPDPFRRN